MNETPPETIDADSDAPAAASGAAAFGAALLILGVGAVVLGVGVVIAHEALRVALFVWGHS